jgi:hypothetical protein
MSKVKAFKCDYCGKIVEYDECVGLKPIEDIFDRLKSYPVVNNPSKAEVHFCVSHYRELVTAPAESQYNRRINEAGYARKCDELAYDLRKTTIDRHRSIAIAQHQKKK